MTMKEIVFGTALTMLCAASASAATVMLSPTHDNRIRSDALTGNSEGTPSDLVGNVSSTRAHRAALAFDLSGIPVGATIDSVTLSATFDPDGSGNSANTDDGTGNIVVAEMLENPDRVNGWNYAFQSFGGDQTGNTGDDTSWATPGGTLGVALSSVADSTYDPEGIAAGTPFAWASSPDFVAAITNNLGDDEVLLQVYIPGVEGGGRSFVRSNNDFVLSVDYTPIPEPSVGFLGVLGALGWIRRRR